MQIKLLLLMLITFNASAACYQLDNAGRKWLTLNTTAKSIGTVSTVKQCKDIVIAQPAPQTCPPIPLQNQLCADTAKILFDAKYNGMRLYINPGADGKERCVFIKPIPSADGVLLQLYDRTIQNADGTNSCQ